MLIPVVVIVWGMIAYRVLNYISGNSDPETATEKNTNTFIIPRADSFSLILDYPDPFIGSAYNNVRFTKNTKNITEKKNISEQKISTKPVWPKLKYNGMIKNNVKGSICAFLNLNGEDMLIATGDTVSGIKVRAIYKDSLVLIRQNTVKTIYK